MWWLKSNLSYSRYRQSVIPTCYSRHTTKKPPVSRVERLFTRFILAIFNTKSQSSSMSSVFVIPGQPITSEQGYLRGHGSYLTDTIEGQTLVSSVAGQIDRVNKLISVRPIKSRYIGEVGDLVVGRISAVDSKRWKVDICAQKDAVLQLSSVNLPGGVQRMRTYEDQLQMRSLFMENDVVCAEIQNINSEGVISLAARSMKYGKLENGQFLTVSASLVKRLPQHYISLPNGIDVILGKNGCVWITRSIPEVWKAQEDELDELTPQVEILQNLKLRHTNTDLLREERAKVARVYNVIKALALLHITISPDTIMSVYQKSIELKLQTQDLIRQENIVEITAHLLQG